MIIIFFLLVLCSLIYIGAPLLQERIWPQLESRRLSALQREKREGIWAISDVDNEYEAGKLTEEDYTHLRTRLKEDLAATMQQERRLLESGSFPKDGDIPRTLKKKLVYEVMRICGIQQS